jgi:hypothetical protein
MSLGLSPEKIEQYREAMRTDLELFGRIVCKDLTPTKTDCVLHHDIQKAYFSDERFQCIIAPRGHAKTTWATTIATAHSIAYDRETCILLIKKTWRNATRDLQNALSIIKYNERFREFFGDFTFLTDRQEESYIENPRTGHRTLVVSGGTGQSLRGLLREGKRPSLILPDDFEDETNSTTAEQREKVRDWVAAQVLPLWDVKTGRTIAIGTIVHHDSWLNNRWENYQKAIEAGEEPSWKVIFHQMVENGKPIWPEQFTPKIIKTIKTQYEELGKIDKYYQEYFNIPFSEEDAPFKKVDIQYFDGYLTHDPAAGTLLNIKTIHDGHGNLVEEKTVKPVDIYCGYDFASGEGKDYVGHNVVAVDGENNRYDIVAERVRVLPDEMKEIMFSDYDTFHPLKMCIEQDMAVRVLQFWLRDEMRRRNKFLPILPVPVKTRQRKEEKLIEALQPLYKAHVMHHKRSQTDSELELLTIPKQKHDDIADAKFLANMYARPCTTKYDTRTNKVVRRMITKVDWMTGRPTGAERRALLHTEYQLTG